jgi:hypothetical protein
MKRKIPNGHDDDTPTATLSPTLDAHRPFVTVLANVIGPLQAVAVTLGQALHEIRVASEPIGNGVLKKISDAGAEIEKVGKSIKEGFGG